MEFYSVAVAQGTPSLMLQVENFGCPCIIHGSMDDARAFTGLGLRAVRKCTNPCFVPVGAQPDNDARGYG